MLDGKFKNPYVDNSLELFFKPKSVAVIGASDREESVGYAVLHNIMQSGFKGSVYPVNVKRDFVQG
jgi:acetyltransferase